MHHRHPPARTAPHTARASSTFVSAALSTAQGSAECRAHTAGRDRDPRAAQELPLGHPSPFPSPLGGGIQPHISCSTEGQRHRM